MRTLSYRTEMAIGSTPEDVFDFCSDLPSELQWNPKVRLGLADPSVLLIVVGGGNDRAARFLRTLNVVREGRAWAGSRR